MGLTTFCQTASLFCLIIILSQTYFLGGQASNLSSKQVQDCIVKINSALPGFYENETSPYNFKLFAKIGDPVLLTCSGWFVNNVNWIKGNDIVQSSEINSSSIGRNPDGKFEKIVKFWNIGRLKDSHANTYSCKSGSCYSKENILDIYPFRLSTKNSNPAVHLDDNKKSEIEKYYSLKCSASPPKNFNKDRQSYQIEWYRFGVNLDNTNPQKYSITKVDVPALWELYVFKFRPSDFGLYNCSLIICDYGESSKLNQNCSSAIITKRLIKSAYISYKPIFSQKSIQLVGYRDEPVVLKCPFQGGYPVNNITWIFKTIPISKLKNNRFKLIYTYEASTGTNLPLKLMITDLKDTDSGNYQCFSQNSYGNGTSAFINLKVETTIKAGILLVACGIGLLLLLLIATCCYCCRSKKDTKAEEDGDLHHRRRRRRMSEELLSECDMEDCDGNKKFTSLPITADSSNDENDFCDNENMVIHEYSSHNNGLPKSKLPQNGNAVLQQNNNSNSQLSVHNSTSTLTLPSRPAPPIPIPIPYTSSQNAKPKIAPKPKQTSSDSGINGDL